MLHTGREEKALAFWSKRRASYPLLAPLAEDLLAAPASQVYVERVFSVCGWLTAGHRNRSTKNLEKQVFVRMNQGLILPWKNAHWVKLGEFP